MAYLVLCYHVIIMCTYEKKSSFMIFLNIVDTQIIWTFDRHWNSCSVKWDIILNKIYLFSFTVLNIKIILKMSESWGITYYFSGLVLTHKLHTQMLSESAEKNRIIVSHSLSTSLPFSVSFWILINWRTWSSIFLENRLFFYKT